VDEELQEKGVVKGGPNTWGAAALSAWIHEQDFGAQLALPEGMNGQQIMKLTVARLTPFCAGDMAVAKQVFDSLRVASKEAAQKDRELRQAMKEGPKPVSSVSFSKAGPSRLVKGLEP
jgi:hypothetical protein